MQSPKQRLDLHKSPTKKLSHIQGIQWTVFGTLTFCALDEQR